MDVIGMVCMEQRADKARRHAKMYLPHRTVGGKIVLDLAGGPFGSAVRKRKRELV